jgi:hypothetical protein
MPVPSKKVFTFPDGEVIDLFYIGELAHRLGRETKTIRSWEISGVIPKTIFKDNSGNRMYSQEQIDTIVSCAEEAQIKQGSKLTHSAFANNVYKQLEVLTESYLNKISEV